MTALINIRKPRNYHRKADSVIPRLRQKITETFAFEQM